MPSYDHIFLAPGFGGTSDLANALTFNGQPITFESENLTYTDEED